MHHDLLNLEDSIRLRWWTGPLRIAIVPVVPHPGTWLRRHIGLHCVLQDIVKIVLGFALRPIDSICVDGGDCIGRRGAVHHSRLGAWLYGLIRVLHRSGAVGRVEIRLGFRVADPLDIGLLVVGFVEKVACYSISFRRSRTVFIERASPLQTPATSVRMA